MSRFRQQAAAGELAVGTTFRLTRTFGADELDERGHARASCRFDNQRGETVLTGTLEGYLPGAEERELLGRMLQEPGPHSPR